MWCTSVEAREREKEKESARTIARFLIKKVYFWRRGRGGRRWKCQAKQYGYSYRRQRRVRQTLVGTSRGQGGPRPRLGLRTQGGGENVGVVELQFHLPACHSDTIRTMLAFAMDDQYVAIYTKWLQYLDAPMNSHGGL